MNVGSLAHRVPTSGAPGGTGPVKRPRGRRGADPRQRLVQRITACWQTQALRVAVQFDVPNLLAGQPQDAATLAACCGCSADGLCRLLRALCVLEVCRERRDGRFELTATGELLRRDVPGGAPSLRAMALWWGGPMWPTWGDLGYSVRTGESARPRHTGAEHYAFLDQQPGMAELFHETMRALTNLIADEVAALEIWNGARDLIDVGGGTGELAAAIALAHSALRVVVLDRPDAGPAATTLFERRGISGRARFLPGDFFAGVPRGADCYLMKSILHNWDDGACNKILARCAEAARPGARLILVERLRPDRLKPGRQDEALARTDLNMLAGLGGRERSLAEFEALLTSHGFTITRTTPTRHEFSVIEAEVAAVRQGH